ncbi:PHP domain-containing protein [bacterium LRH843]|nr:PHP domain-containing protein [bacterium LRH843]
MKTRKNSDLHLHSTASDGGYTPTELMHKCKQNNLEIVALTDHDTVDGLDEAISAGDQLGIKVIPGIEFSTIFNGKSVHILGYGFDWENKQLQEMLKFQKELRRERLEQMLEKLRQIGLLLTKEQVLTHVDGGSVGRPHVAKALIEAGYVKNVAEAFDLYLAEGRPAYAKKSREMTVKEAIDWIHQTEGLAIVAHPVYYNLDEEIVEWSCKWNLDGIEVYHRDHNEKTIQRYENLCIEIEKKRRKPLYRTGGSDFHHEDYGRVLQPLGVTRISNDLAIQIAEKIKSD